MFPPGYIDVLRKLEQMPQEYRELVSLMTSRTRFSTDEAIEIINICLEYKLTPDDIKSRYNLTK